MAQREFASFIILGVVVLVSLAFINVEWSHIEASNQQLLTLEDNVLIKELKRQIDERDVRTNFLL
jgi:hypothetical protein